MVKKRKPLSAGTEIEYDGETATVIQDDGGETLKVLCGEILQTWSWTFDGESCTVIPSSAFAKLRAERDELARLLAEALPYVQSFHPDWSPLEDADERLESLCDKITSALLAASVGMKK